MSSSSTDGPPGALAVIDNQGNLGFCSRFALGKAAANGFMLGKFYPHQQLDFVQGEITSAIVNTDEVSRIRKDVKNRCIVFFRSKIFFV